MIEGGSRLGLTNQAGLDIFLANLAFEMNLRATVRRSCVSSAL